MSDCTCPARARQWNAAGTCDRCLGTVSERQLTPVLLKILCAPDSGLVLWRNNAGLNTHWPDGRKRDAPIRYGIGPGGGDWIGLYRGGLHVEVEMKSRTGAQSPDQRAHQAIVDRQEGVYAVVRTAEQARELLQRLRTHGVK